MRNFLLLVVAWGVAGSAWAVPLLVVSFNVENSLGGATNPVKLTLVAERLERIGADVVTLQELFTSDSSALNTLGTRLGLPYRTNTFSLNKIHNQAILSRYPILSVTQVFGSGMVRPILLAQIDVPNLTMDPYVAVVHLKASGGDTNQFQRAVEMTRLKMSLLAKGVSTNTHVLLMGDFNHVSPSDLVFSADPDGSAGSGWVTDLPYPITAFANTDGYFPDLGIYKLDLRQVGGTTDTYITGGALDHIMVSEPIRSRQPASEIYHAANDAAGVGGLAKFGGPPATAYTYTSDHLPVFADLVLRDAGDGFADDPVPPTLSWNVSSNELTFVSRPVVSAAADVTATDDQDPAPVVSCYPLNPTYTSAGTKKITYMARDRMGNIRTLDRMVTVAAWGQGGVTHNLQWPPSMQIPINGQGTVYAQIQIPGWTETVEKVAPNVRCWVGVHTQNTDPSAWPTGVWKEASLNSSQAFGTNADEYMLPLQAGDTGPGVFFYAVRWQINGGLYGYGGVASGGGGGAWDGAVNSAGVLTVGSTIGNWSSNAPVTPEQQRRRQFTIAGEDHTPVKARVLLMVALTKTTDRNELQRIFSEY